jgi:hypothetical protein
MQGSTGVQTMARLPFIGCACLALWLGTPGFPALAADPAPNPSGMREVNVTTDSAPGWTPSRGQERAAEAAAQAFFALKDVGKADAAYAMYAQGLKDMLPFETFSAELAKFRAQAGALRDRRILKTTWTKDPAQAPAPGIYAALDIASRFDKIDRDCGYIVLYQPDETAPFVVVREESNIIDNASAKQIEATQSRAALDEAWARLSANCPNYSVAGSPR